MDITTLKTGQACDLSTIQQVLSGNKNAFAFICKKYKKHIYHKFLSYLRVEEDAEDATMLALTKIYENIDKYKEEYTFNSWATRIAHNVMIDFYRKRNRHEGDIVSIDKVISGDNIKDDSKSMNHQIVDHVKNPEEAYIENEKKQMLQLAISKLRKKSYRQMLILIYFEDKSYEETATIMDINIRSLKPYIHRAKKELKEIIRKGLNNENNIY